MPHSTPPVGDGINLKDRPLSTFWGKCLHTYLST
jgi:hypothetical protein